MPPRTSRTSHRAASSSSSSRTAAAAAAAPPARPPSPPPSPSSSTYQPWVGGSSSAGGVGGVSAPAISAQSYNAPPLNTIATSRPLTPPGRSGGAYSREPLHAHAHAVASPPPSAYRFAGRLPPGGIGASSHHQSQPLLPLPLQQHGHGHGGGGGGGSTTSSLDTSGSSGAGAATARGGRGQAGAGLAGPSSSFRHQGGGTGPGVYEQQRESRVLPSSSYAGAAGQEDELLQDDEGQCKTHHPFSRFSNREGREGCPFGTFL